MYQISLARSVIPIPLLGACVTFAGAAGVASAPAASVRPEVVQQQLQMFGLLPPGEAAVAGQQLRRVFIVGSHDRPLGTISAQRKPGKPPSLSFYGGGARRLKPISTNVSERAWRSIVSRSAGLSAPPKSAPASAAELCVEHWKFHVEIVDPAVRAAPPQIRTSSGGACTAPRTVAYSLFLAELAGKLIRPCRDLSTDETDSISRLLLCAKLEGVAGPAIQVANMLGIVQDLGEGELQSPQAILSDDTTLKIGNRTHRGGLEVLASWREIAQDPLYSGLAVDILRGVTRDRVKMSGRITYADHAGAPLPAREQDVFVWWQRGKDGRMKVASISIE